MFLHFIWCLIVRYFFSLLHWHQSLVKIYTLVSLSFDPFSFEFLTLNCFHPCLLDLCSSSKKGETRAVGSHTRTVIEVQLYCEGK